MKMKRLEMIKEKLLCALEAETCHLDQADAKEMGEVMDMIKDIEEACYYHTVTEAMKESGDKDEIEHQLDRYTPYQKRYYTPMTTRRGNPDYRSMPNGYKEMDMDMDRDESMTSRDTRWAKHNSDMYEGGNQKNGHSHIARRTYMESKEMHKGQDEQMKHLEEYMKELSTDITDMIKDSTPQEKTMLKQKLATLVSMINS